MQPPEATSDSLTGNFFADFPDAAASLQNAANTPLPPSARALLKLKEASSVEIVDVLSNEKSTANGFWRVVLASLIHAKNKGIRLPAMPEEISTQTLGLIAQAEATQPEIFERPEFLQHCFSIIQNFENRASESSEAPATTTSRSAPRSIDRAGGLPSIRYVEAGSAYACTNYSLIDDKNNVLFQEELAVEDMLFIAHSAVSNASRALGAALKVTMPGLLVRHHDDEFLSSRVQAIKADVDELLEVLLALPLEGGQDADV